MEHHQTIERPLHQPPERAIQVGGQLIGVKLPLFNFKF